MRRILLLGIAIILVACGRDDVASPATPTPSTISGSYRLTTVDGQSLPFVAIDLGAYQARLVSGTLDLNANGTYSLELNHRVDDSGNVRTGTDSDVGVWKITRDSIALASTAGNFAKTGTVSGNVITLQASIRVLVLTK
jgi:hypothetical protein